jgi:DNA modification methylase
LIQDFASFESHEYLRDTLALNYKECESCTNRTAEHVISKAAEHVISKLTVQDDIVFDPLMGAATTGIAALRLKRRFIGTEKDKDTFVMAKATIDRELSYLGPK